MKPGLYIILSRRLKSFNDFQRFHKHGEALNKPKVLTFEVCILAGGLSRRMGTDKARLRLGSRTMLQHVQAAAKATGLPVRVISKDLIPNCGPLGGLYTALKTTKHDAILALACDMPFVTPDLLIL